MENEEVLSPENNSGAGDNFSIEELLDFGDTDDGDNTFVVAVDATVDSSNSSFSGEEYTFSGENIFQSSVDPQLSADLCIPHEDIVALEWLSNFVEDSFSSKDLQNMDLISGTKPPLEANSDTRSSFTESDPNLTQLQPEPLVPGKSRTKRPRTAPCDWSSRLSILSPPTTPPSPFLSDTPIHCASDKTLQWREWPMGTKIASNDQPLQFASAETPHSGSMGRKTSFNDHALQFAYDNTAQSSSLGRKTPSSNHTSPKKKREVVAGVDGRRCLHCDTDKTPQWRTGPMGPKTLCNACGVRYKSGRLVPEYRPAASPTFVTAKHSNSHRKVIEIRRQKETQKRVGHRLFDMGGGTVVFDGFDGDDYLIHQPMGPAFRHLI